jgi:hypothetical protein
MRAVVPSLVTLSSYLVDADQPLGPVKVVDWRADQDILRLDSRAGNIGTRHGGLLVDGVLVVTAVDAGRVRASIVHR